MINLDKVTVLSIEPGDEHQKTLADILRRSDWAAGTLISCSGTESALTALRSQRAPIVLCDSQADWRRLLDELRSLPDPPFLIVTSRLADDRLWSEALNLGAYDVLAKPFDRAEVSRVLTMAWMRWAGRSTRSFPSIPRQPLTQVASYA